MYNVFYNAFFREFPFDKSLDDILLDISEFPLYFMVYDIMIAAVMLIFSYLLLPSGHVKYKYAVFVVFIAVFLIFQNDTAPNTNYSLKKENIENLTKTTGVLYYEPFQRYHAGGYHILQSNVLQNNNKQCLSFELCTKDIDDYLGKNITIWHNYNIVYQVSCNQKIIYDIERSNEKVWLILLSYGIQYVVWRMVSFVFMYCFVLSSLNNIEKS